MGYVCSIYRDLAKTVNKLSKKYNQDPMQVIGELFTLEYIKSKYVEYPLTHIFEDENNLDRKYINKNFIKRGNGTVLMVNADDLVDFIACNRKFKSKYEEKQYVLKALENVGLGSYDEFEDAFYYTGSDALMKIIRQIYYGGQRREKNENIHRS